MSKSDRDYPAELSVAALHIFLDWFGHTSARSTKILEKTLSENQDLLQANIQVGRQWDLSCTVIDTLSIESDLSYESARAAVEARLDSEELSIALWPPRAAPLPQGEPGLSELILAIRDAKQVSNDDTRLEIRRPVHIYLRRTSTTGSVVPVLGGLSSLWAQFTNRVPGSFQLESTELHRLPHNEEEREELIESIVNASTQPDVDDGRTLPAIDAWTAVWLREPDLATVMGSPRPTSDTQASSLRRNLRKLLISQKDVQKNAEQPRALIVIGSALTVDEEKLSWILKGMDPSLYVGFSIIVVIVDGSVKPVIVPQEGALPWDVPLPN